MCNRLRSPAQAICALKVLIRTNNDFQPYQEWIRGRRKRNCIIFCYAHTHAKVINSKALQLLCLELGERLLLCTELNTFHCSATCNLQIWHYWLLNYCKNLSECVVCNAINKQTLLACSISDLNEIERLAASAPLNKRKPSIA